MLIIKKYLICFGCVLFLVSCGEDSEKPTLPKSAALEALSGKWIFNDCWLEYNFPDNPSGIGEMYQNLQEEFTTDYKFKFIYTLYYKSGNCSQDAIARVIQTGTFNLHSPYVASFANNPTKTVDAWQMDITFDNVIIEGNRLLALERIDAVNRFQTYYDIVALGQDVKYDASMVNSVLNRPTDLRYTSLRIDNFSDLMVEPGPTYDKAPTAADFIGDWDWHCRSDSQTANDATKMYSEQHDFSVSAGNLFQFKNTLWSGVDCKGTEIASITMTGKLVIDQPPTITTVSKVTATTMKLVFDNVPATVGGDFDAAIFSMDYGYRMGNTYYKFMFTDPKYTLLFYGGWFEKTTLNLPDEFEYHGHRY